MGKLGKSIQAGLWLSQYWKLLTTTNNYKPPPASCSHLFGSFLAPPRYSHSVVYLERQCPPLSALFLFFLSFRVIQTLYLHRNSLTLWSGPCRSLNRTSPSALSLLLWVWLSPPRACQFELKAVCAGLPLSFYCCISYEMSRQKGSEMKQGLTGLS